MTITNPFLDTAQQPYTAHEAPTSLTSLDERFKKLADTSAADAVVKRNMAPAGTYITDPDTFPIIQTMNRDEKDKSETVIGQRVIVRLITRATARVKGDDVLQFFRVELSPDVRHKKVYVDEQWTGEYDTSKDDMASRLWAQAVSAYQEYHGKGTPFSEGDVLEYLRTVPVALRAFQGNRGELVVNNLSSRGGTVAKREKTVKLSVSFVLTVPEDYSVKFVKEDIKHLYQYGETNKITGLTIETVK